MVVAVAVARTEKCNVVDMSGRLLEELTDIHAAFTVFLKGEGRAGEVAFSTDLSRLYILAFKELTINLLQVGLGVKGVHLTGPTFHHQEDHGLGPGWKVRQLGIQWAGLIRYRGGARLLVMQHPRQRNSTQANIRAQQELTTTERIHFKSVMFHVLQRPGSQSI